jgi:hypothetical protein
MSRLAQSDRLPFLQIPDSMEPMNGGRNQTASQRSLQVSHREGLALLAALELAPFDDEVLTQKLLDVVYRDEPAHSTSRRPHSARDFGHRRHQAH